MAEAQDAADHGEAGKSVGLDEEGSLFCWSPPACARRDRSSTFDTLSSMDDLEFVFSDSGGPPLPSPDSGFNEQNHLCLSPALFVTGRPPLSSPPAAGNRVSLSPSSSSYLTGRMNRMSLSPCPGFNASVNDKENAPPPSHSQSPAFPPAGLTSIFQQDAVDSEPQSLSAAVAPHRRAQHRRNRTQIISMRSLPDDI